MQLAGTEGVVQLFEEEPAEQARQNPHRQEEAGAAGDPALAIGGDAAARHHAMHMGMMQQVLSPGVQDGEEADLGAQVLGIGGDGAQGFGAGVKEQVVDEPSCSGRQSAAIGSGTVKTTWKYSTSSSSACRSSSHCARASDWHLGQGRWRQEL